MTDEEYEFVLTDRIAKIQAINEQYDLEHNAYLSFSRGFNSNHLSNGNIWGIVRHRLERTI